MQRRIALHLLYELLSCSTRAKTTRRRRIRPISVGYSSIERTAGVSERLDVAREELSCLFEKPTKPDKLMGYDQTTQHQSYSVCTDLGGTMQGLTTNSVPTSYPCRAARMTNFATESETRCR